MNTDTIPQCQCPTCVDPRAAIIADLLDQCACSAESICSACHALGTLTDTRRCESCREWSPVTTTILHRALCDTCADDAGDDKEWWDGSDR